MFQSSHELLNQYIKQSLQGQDIKNIESIFYFLDKIDDLVIQESIKKIGNEEEFISLKVLFDHKIILITFLFIKDYNTEEILELIPYLNTLNHKQSQAIISIQEGSLGIIIEEGSFISLNQMISKNQMNYEKIKQLAYDLVEQLAILHQQNICLFNYSINDVYLNLESNKFLIKFCLDLLRVQSDQFIFNYSQKVYMDPNFPIPEIVQLDLQPKQFKILNPFLIDSWNLGVLILNTFIKINQETSTDLKYLLEKYFLNVCGIDYILMSGVYYKNQNDLQFLLQETNRNSIFQFIQLINCTKLLKLCETNLDGSDEFINLANCCETIKKQYLKGKLLKIKSINNHMINLEFIEDINQNQLPIHNQIQLTVGQLIINSQIIRVIPHFQIYHNTNKLILDSNLTNEKLIQIIMTFQDLQIYSIDTESLLLFLQYQNINFKKISKLQKQFQFEIHNLIFYDNLNNQNLLDELLHLFNNFNLNRLEIKQDQIPINQNEQQFAQNIFNKINLDQIRVLILSNTYLTDQTLSIISTFSSLSNLNLSKCQCLSTHGLCGFFKQSQFCNLVTLDISKTKSDETVFEAIWKNKSYIALTSFNISDCSFSNLTLITQTIAQINAKQEKIQELYMSGCDLNNSVLTALQQITLLNCLDISNNPKLNQFYSLNRDNKYNYLNLEQCEMKSQDIIFVLNLECLIKSKLQISTRCQNTSIYNIQITQRSISLTNLQIKNFQIDQDVSEIKFINLVIGQKRAFLSQEFNKLTILQLQNCQIDDKDISILSTNQNLNQLQELNLNQNNLSDNSLNTILSTFKQLINLGFDNSKITKNSIQYIIASSLKILSIKFCIMLQAEDILSLLISLGNQLEYLDISYNNMNIALKKYLENEKLNLIIKFDQNYGENDQKVQHIQSFKI